MTRRRCIVAAASGELSAVDFEKEGIRQLVVEDRYYQFIHAVNDHPTLAPIVGWCLAVRFALSPVTPAGAPGERRTALLGPPTPQGSGLGLGVGQVRWSISFGTLRAGGRPGVDVLPGWCFLGPECPRSYPASVIGRSVLWVGGQVKSGWGWPAPPSKPEPVTIHRGRYGGLVRLR